MRILSLQPYFGGSHRAFQEAWQRHSRHEWTVLTLPPRHWKWRMRHSAIEFARILRKDFVSDSFDVIFCSDFLNLAEFKGIAPKKFADLPSVIYFHENQFAYPNRKDDPRDLHYGFTNFTSCLAADEIWFNSNFNFNSFFEGLEKACLEWPDYPPIDAVNSIHEKVFVQQPGIELPAAQWLYESTRMGRNPVHLIWAARWEHDKNPRLLLQALETLERQDFDFRLSVIGQSFRNVPEEFEQMRRKFTDRIASWGFQESRSDYWRALAGADIFVSTADHEFFGIAAAEAIAAGLYPILPDRLAYPELINAVEFPVRREYFLFEGGANQLADSIIRAHMQFQTPDCVSSLTGLRNEIIGQNNWKRRSCELDDLIAKVGKAGLLRLNKSRALESN